MYYKQLVQFLQLAIFNFRPDLLVFIGDVPGSETLMHIQSRLHTTLPAIKITLNGDIFNIFQKTKCPYCPPNRLTIIYCSDSVVDGTSNMTLSKDTNRVVFVRSSKTLPLGRIVKVFQVHNMVLAEIDVMGNLEVLAWGNKKVVNKDGSVVLSRFKGPEAIFHSQDDSNALLFRNVLNSYPRSGSTTATFLTVMTAPYNFLVNDQTTGKQQLASSSLELIQIIGKIMHFSQKIKFFESSNCKTCFEALPLVKNTGPVKLFPYEHDVVVKKANSVNSEILIMHYMFTTNDNKMFALRRYVAIVPYRTGAQDGSSIIINSLLNAAVLMCWLCGAAIFTALRVPMHTVVPAGRSDRRLGSGYNRALTKFFSCLAGVLGNSFGSSDKCVCKAESFLVFVIGVFATLTSMMFTGAIFEQLLVAEPPKQIDTLQELYASKLKIIECWGDLQIEYLYHGMNNKKTTNTSTLTCLEIERALLKHNTQYAFVLPESIADILDYPEMKYSNGTPVYHVVAETYKIMPHFLVFFPYTMQKRFFLFWNRLIESGIDTHLNNMNEDLYKAIRFKWSRLFNRNKLNTDPSNTVDFGAELMLYMLVLGFGYTMAIIVFGMELLYDRLG